LNKKQRVKRFINLKIRINTSSKLKRTPPIGAPKATETPAAAAADNISLFLASLRPYLGNKYDKILPKTITIK